MGSSGKGTLVAGTGVTSRGQESYDEMVAERSELSFDPGHGLMKWFLQ